MRRLLFGAVILGGGVLCLAPAMATSWVLSGLSRPHYNAIPVEKVGYWKRQFRRYGYPAPYAYYPPAYGYYPPPPAYAYPPTLDGYPPGYAYSPPVYGDQVPPPPVGGAYPSAEGDYGDYPPADRDYPPADDEYGDYPANGS
jgi:hypothetical protein